MTDQPSIYERAMSPLIRFVDATLFVSRRINTFYHTMPGVVPMPNIEAMMLRHVYRSPGITPSQLAEDIRLRPSNASVALRNLENKGMILRVPDEEDRRSTRLQVTEEAKRHMGLVHQEWSEILDFAGVSDDEYRQALDVMLRLKQALKR